MRLDIMYIIEAYCCRQCFRGGTQHSFFTMKTDRGTIKYMFSLPSVPVVRYSNYELCHCFYVPVRLSAVKTQDEISVRRHNFATLIKSYFRT
jgi:hypothetical protein